SRLAWLAQYLPTLPGSGIVYTLTVRDAERVAAFLRLRGIDAVAYHADSADREMLEARLLRNDLKVLVATVALGMGFDKPDLGFVVHFQRPGSVVHYYQQIGRAGRAVDEAFGILLGGAEDDEIIDFFIRQAFPPEGDVLDVLEALNCADDGLSVAQIESFVNLPFSRIERTLKLLATETPAPIRKEGSKWYRSPVPYVFNVGKVQQLTTIRRREQQRMQEYMRSSDCLMQFLAAELDDPFAAPCGKCANCAGRVVPVEVPIEGVIAANEFLQRTRVTIEPRKLWPVAAMVKDGFKGKIAPFQNEPGRALALWEDGGWAELRGTDMIATAAALNEGGRVIAILPEGLGRPSVISRYRDAIVDGRLLLLSSVYPDAGFTIGNAMGRNKVIYGIAESAVIVRADANTGGTWAGAEAELKREDAIPVFVRAEGDLADGNRALIALGAHEFPPQPWSDLRALLTTSRMSANVGEKPTPGQRSLFEHRTDRATTRM
ncbi:MAG TPA: DNA-processing protein DprA, partial [Thermoanaerobaculia bacterium]|nr:DNA-processing protein DprA [Thermoanaerobaculia bacterium]